jgi:hypothetical protein
MSFFFVSLSYGDMKDVDAPSCDLGVVYIENASPYICISDHFD